MRLPLIVTATAAAMLGAACANTPTGAPGAGTPYGPSYEGGVMYGSGNRTVGTSTATGAHTAPGADSLLVTTAARGGVMYGSGN
jgi:hypothetical protein